MKIKEIKKAIKKFEAYDRVYFDGRLSSALIVVLSFIIIICIILLIVIKDYILGEIKWMI